MNERMKKVLSFIKRANKYGLDIEKITEGKNLETLARSSKTVDNMEKRFKRQKERPKILKEVEKINKRLTEKSVDMLKGTKGFLSKGVKNYSKYFLNGDLNKNKLINSTNKELDYFFDKYFKEVKHDAEAQSKINKLKKRFGIRIDLAFDFMNHIYKTNFKYEIERELLRSEAPDQFNEMLKDRLDEFDRILKREFKL